MWYSTNDMFHYMFKVNLLRLQVSPVGYTVVELPNQYWRH